MTNQASDTWHTLPGWTTAHRGLKLYFWGLIALVSFSVLVGIITIIVSMNAASSSFGQMDEIMSATMAVAKVQLVGSLLIQTVLFIGLWRYKQVPAESGARVLAEWALILAVASVLLSAVNTVQVLVGDSADVMELAEKAQSIDVVSLLATLTGLVSFIAFVRSMGAAAFFIGAFKVVERARTTLILAIVVVCLTLLSMFLTPAVPQLGILLGLGLLGIGIWALVYYLMVIWGLATSIAAEVDLTKVFD